eukprot:7230742-Alexandrium_andersonii.AAC.1
MSASLVGSEMCIRDRPGGAWVWAASTSGPRWSPARALTGPSNKASSSPKKETIRPRSARLWVLAPYSELSEGSPGATASRTH